MTEQKNIRSVRKSHNLTQDMMSDILGVSRVTIANWEAGTYIPLQSLARIIETSHPGEKRHSLAVEMMSAYLETIMPEQVGV